MHKIRNEEAFRMISLLKSSFRSVRRETNKLKNKNSISHQEKYEKLEAIEQKCIEQTLNLPDIDEEFILNLHNLLMSYNSVAHDSEAVYRDFLLKYVDGNIEELIGFMHSNLFAEYDYAISHPKYIINLYIGNE